MDNPSKVELLLSKGADKKILGMDGKTCLEIAQEYDYEEIIELLEKE